MFLCDQVQELTEAEGVEFEGMEAAGRKHGESDNVCAFDHRRLSLRAPPPVSLDGFVRGIDGGRDLFLGADQLANDFTEAISAIAHGEQLELIAGTSAQPAGSDDAGRFVGAKCALEFVRDDQDSHRGKGSHRNLG